MLLSCAEFGLLPAVITNEKTSKEKCDAMVSMLSKAHEFHVHISAYTSMDCHSCESFTDGHSCDPNLLEAHCLCSFLLRCYSSAAAHFASVHSMSELGIQGCSTRVNKQSVTMFASVCI